MSLSSSTSRTSPQELMRLVRSGQRLRSHKLQRVRETVIMGLLVACAGLSVVVTFAIVVLLFQQSLPFFWQKDGTFGQGLSRLAEFLTGTTWDPSNPSHTGVGIWPLISGTLNITFWAIVVALPSGLITAVYLSEYAPRRVRAFLKPILELLAGIPTVVYGVFALSFITPLLKNLYEGFGIYNVTSAGIAVGILCIPIICSLSEDALRAVPRGLREGAFGLGGTRFDVSVKVVLPAALSGIISATLLAIARAIGETMVVAIAAGSQRVVSVNPTRSMQTMTGYMVDAVAGEAPAGSTEYYSLYAVAAMLFVVTMTLTILGELVRTRFREAYK